MRAATTTTTTTTSTTARKCKGSLQSFYEQISSRIWADNFFLQSLLPGDKLDDISSILSLMEQLNYVGTWVDLVSVFYCSRELVCKRLDYLQCFCCHRGATGIFLQFSVHFPKILDYFRRNLMRNQKNIRDVSCSTLEIRAFSVWIMHKNPVISTRFRR